MQEFLLILIAIFVLFKIFGRPNVIYYNQHNHSRNEPQAKVNVNSRNSKNNNTHDDGEYVDYEEVK